VDLAEEPPGARSARHGFRVGGRQTTDLDIQGGVVRDVAAMEVLVLESAEALDDAVGLWGLDAGAD
jgi:hypothetical protein